MVPHASSLSHPHLLSDQASLDVCTRGRKRGAPRAYIDGRAPGAHKGEGLENPELGIVRLLLEERGDELQCLLVLALLLHIGNEKKEIPPCRVRSGRGDRGSKGAKKQRKQRKVGSVGATSAS